LPKTPRRSAPRRFDAEAFLDSAGVTRTVAKYAARRKVFAQGDSATQVFYLRAGAVRLSVLSKTGREAVIGGFGPGDFFGEGCLAGQHIRMATATTTQASTVLVIKRDEMARLLHEEPGLSDRFIVHILGRSIQIEENLVDQLFNSSEKRLARTLLLLARYGKDNTSMHTISGVSQEVLAEMVGTTRSRINFFMNKFRRLGFIQYNGRITIKKSLLSVVLHD
jgi:CRP/FNR family cyclic AMP-dependent transcriptional regulator